MTDEAIICIENISDKEANGETYSLVRFNDRPFLEYQLNYLKAWGIDHVLLVSDGQIHQIKENFGETFNDVRLEYVEGNNEATWSDLLKRAMKVIQGSKVFLLSDRIFYDVNLQRLFDFHRMMEADVALVLRFVDDVYDYAEVKYDDEHRVTEVGKKGDISGNGYIDSRFYLVSRRFLMSNEDQADGSLKGALSLHEPEAANVFGIRCFSFFADISMEGGVEDAENELKRFQF